jgi:GNAT superfamily N-acetyltransferase
VRTNPNITTSTEGRDVTTSERDGNASAPTAPASAGESAPAAPVVAGAAGSRGNDDGIVVRTARADDAPALAALSTELGYPADTVQIERRLSGVLAADDDVVFVAVARPDDVVGFVHALEKRLLVSEPYVELGGLIVASAARRRGAARLLIEAVERWTIARGVDLLRVRSGRTRRVADIAYRRCGFELEKEQRVFIKRLAGLRAPGAPS